MVKILGGSINNGFGPRRYVCAICEKKGEYSEFYKKKDLKQHKVQDHSYHTSSS